MLSPLWRFSPLNLHETFPQPKSNPPVTNTPSPLTQETNHKPIRHLKVKPPKRHKPKVRHEHKKKRTAHKVRSCVPSAPERWIITRESGGNVHADNPSSTAFGLGQLLYGNRARYGQRLGVSPGTVSYCAQLKMFRLYVRERYRTAGNAIAFWQAHGWY